MPYGNAPTGTGAPGNAMRNRITQALMNIQNPPPRSQMPAPPQLGTRPMPMPMPGRQMTGAPPGAMPQAATGVPGMGGFPGGMSGGAMPGGMPGAMPGGAMPGGMPGGGMQQTSVMPQAPTRY